MTKLKVELIGYGTIGMEVERKLTATAWADVCGVLVRQEGRTADSPPTTAAPIVTCMDALLASHPDVVVECAGHETVDAYAERILDAGCDMMMVSVGALASSQRYERLHE